MSGVTDPPRFGEGPEETGSDADPAVVTTPEATITIRFEPVARVALALGVLGAGYAIGRGLGDGPAPAAVAGAPIAPAATAAPRAVSISAAPGAAPASGGVPVLGDPGHPLSGQVPLEVTGTLLDGTAVKLTDYVGQPLMINFWATWCPPCRFEMPWLQKAYDAHKAEGLVILAVNAGERVPPSMAADTAKSFFDQMGLTFPALMPDDPYAAQAAYQVFGLPSSYFVTREGIIAEVVTGMFPSEAAFEATLVRALGLSPVPQP